MKKILLLLLTATVCGAQGPVLNLSSSGATAGNIPMAGLNGSLWVNVASLVTNLDASVITSGTFAVARLPALGLVYPQAISNNYAGNFTIAGDIFADDISVDGGYTGNGSLIDSLNASQLASGTVPTGRLGSGTANNTTFLRGDQTWAAVSSDSLWGTNAVSGSITNLGRGVLIRAAAGELPNQALLTVQAVGGINTNLMEAMSLDGKVFIVSQTGEVTITNATGAAGLAILNLRGPLVSQNITNSGSLTNFGPVNVAGSQTNTGNMVIGASSIYGFIGDPQTGIGRVGAGRAGLYGANTLIAEANNTANALELKAGKSLSFNATVFLDSPTSGVISNRGAFTTRDGLASYAAHIPVAVTIGASPFSFTNNNPVAIECYFSGATAYAVDKNGVNVYGSLAGDAYFVLQPTSRCAITYTVAPTMLTNAW